MLPYYLENAFNRIKRISNESRSHLGTTKTTKPNMNQNTTNQQIVFANTIPIVDHTVRRKIPFCHCRKTNAHPCKIEGITVQLAAYAAEKVNYYAAPSTAPLKIRTLSTTTIGAIVSCAQSMGDLILYHVRHRRKTNQKK